MEECLGGAGQESSNVGKVSASRSSRDMPRAIGDYREPLTLAFRSPALYYVMLL